jgi:hypothetical protein
MRADLLHVITVIANPIRWHSRTTLYEAFERHMLESGVRLTVAELAYGERPFQLAGRPGISHLGLRTRSLLWSKENLINLALSRLPDDWKYTAWIDADIHFRRPDWAVETVHALQQYDIVQPWSDCYDLGPKNDHMLTHRSFCRLWHEGKPIRPAGGGYEFAHPGYAWAATREALQQTGGLIDTAILGAGDHHMALALIGRARESAPKAVTPAYLRPLLAWEERAERFGGNISYVPGTIEHMWHGPKNKRAYVDRWGILTRHAFDPNQDLKRNTWGVWELAGNKPQLAQDIDRYLRSRDEDSNSLG